MKRGCSDTDVLTFRRIFEIVITYCALKLLVTVCAQDIQGDLLQSLEVRCSRVSKQLSSVEGGKPAFAFGTAIVSGGSMGCCLRTRTAYWPPDVSNLLANEGAIAKYETDCSLRLQYLSLRILQPVTGNVNFSHSP
jgi:hypothetical protein